MNVDSTVSLLDTSTNREQLYDNCNFIFSKTLNLNEYSAFHMNHGDKAICCRNLFNKMRLDGSRYSRSLSLYGPSIDHTRKLFYSSLSLYLIGDYFNRFILPCSSFKCMNIGRIN